MCSLQSVLPTIMFLDFYAVSRGIVVLVSCLCLEVYQHAIC